MNNSYFDRLPKFKPSQEALDKRAFDEEMNKTAGRVIDLIPDLLADIIDGEAARLADLVPEVLRKPDPVTHQRFDERHVAVSLPGRWQINWAVASTG